MAWIEAPHEHSADDSSAASPQAEQKGPIKKSGSVTEPPPDLQRTNDVAYWTPGSSDDSARAITFVGADSPRIGLCCRDHLQYRSPEKETCRFNLSEKAEIRPAVRSHLPKQMSHHKLPGHPTYLNGTCQESHLRLLSSVLRASLPTAGAGIGPPTLVNSWRDSPTWQTNRLIRQPSGVAVGSPRCPALQISAVWELDVPEMLSTFSKPSLGHSHGRDWDCRLSTARGSPCPLQCVF